MSTLQTTKADFALWLVVPVKPFGEGKSRLSAVLSSALRAELSQRWLTHILNLANRWGHFAGIAVISRDEAVLTLASTLGARPIVEAKVEAENDLNAALTQAGEIVAAAGAEGILVLPSDLPLLAIADLAALYAFAQGGDGVIIAPSHDGGTNALLLRPPHAIPYAFGLESYTRHAALAETAGLPCHVYHSATIALDIDHPEDLLQANG
jgi:2-phospho-L-lactate guanylyltransferase